MRHFFLRACEFLLICGGCILLNYGISALTMLLFGSGKGPG